MKFDYSEIPADLEATANKWREKMVESGRRSDRRVDESSISKNGDLTEEQIILGMRTRTIAFEIQPMLCGSAFKNKGVQAMLDAVIELMPLRLIFRTLLVKLKKVLPTSRKADDEEKFSALAFKMMTDPFVGQLIFVRVYSGVINKG